MSKEYENNPALKYFKEISAIPRSSKNEKAIADYLVGFAEQRGLEFFRDEIDNVVIKKAGSAGFENLPAIMLQGHTDMVCEKNADTKHDFAAEGIKLIEKDGFLKAQGTTLGADDGVAVAYMLALLDDKTAVHPPLECVFTVQEEIGLVGAAKLDGSVLQAKTMINLDGELFGSATVSCAGGLRAYLRRKFTRTPKASVFKMKVAIRGLLGGHSGIDIIRGRGNANKILGRILNNVLRVSDEAEICELSGGAKDNAIPRESDCTLLFMAGSTRDTAAGVVTRTEKEIKDELKETDPDFRVEITMLDDTNANSIGRDMTHAIVHLISLAPDGVIKRSESAGGFVVASSNLGVIESGEDEVVVTFAPRSSVSSLQNETKHQLELLGSTFGFDVEFLNEYPGWSYAPESPIRDAFAQVFTDMFSDELKVEAVHAGLECGLFIEKLPGLDAVSVGPTVFDVHTPQEKLDLASFYKVWLLLLNVLRKFTENKQ
jgi:dipeptidase D